MAFVPCNLVERKQCVSHQRSLYSALIIHLFENTISKFSTSENAIFLPVCVAEQAGLILALSETPKADFAAYAVNSQKKTR